MSNQVSENSIINEKIKKVEELKEVGVEPYGRHYEKKDEIQEINKYDETSDRVFKTAGRIVAFRRMGKNGFGHLQDPTGKLQYYVKKDEVGEEQYEIYTKLGVGDFIGIEGTLFRTKTGELTLRASSFEVLSKNIRPLPEKFHGLTDVETRYRQRYVDLVMNPEVMETMKKRFQIIRFFRIYLEKKGIHRGGNTYDASYCRWSDSKTFCYPPQCIGHGVVFKDSSGALFEKVACGGI